MAKYDYKGVIHCHSTYSDGTGSMEEIANAANEVGLDYVIMTDHDTMKPGDDGHNKWQGSTLFMCGTEITPPNNHYIVFGEKRLENVEKLRMKSPQEYIDAVKAAGWHGFIAHPDHIGTKRFEIPSYKWLDWNVSNFTGMGLWDLMTDWQSQLDRDELSLEVYTEFASWLAGPRQETVARWDELNQARKVVGIGEIDNHKYEKEWKGQKFQVFPYETAFRTITNHVLIDKPLEKDYSKATKQILQAIAYGSVYVAFDYWDDPTDFNFEIDNGEKNAGMGDEITVGIDKTELIVMLPDEALVNVFHNGQSIYEDDVDEVLLEITEPGTYRVEAMRNDLTWILSNNIYVKE